MKIPEKLKPRLRLLSIYEELGYIPWKKPAKPKKERKKKKKKEEGVYMGAREAIIPFLNDDSKRTFSHLLLRPGYLMRDYILRGQHERYLAPFTAMLVFYSVFTLLVAIVKPDTGKDSMGDSFVESLNGVSVQVDSTDTIDQIRNKEVTGSLLNLVSDAVLLTRLDKYPEKADTPWKQSLAAVEGDLRSKGIHLFLGRFLLLWMAMAFLLRKRDISVSGAAAASAYVLCQYCVFMFLALIFTRGENTELGIALLGLLLLIDYRQLLGIKTKPAFWLTMKTGLVIVAIELLLVILLAIILVILAVIQLI